MAGKKFSEFTSGVAVDSNTRIAGYVNGGTTNNIYTPTELAAGLQQHLLQSFIVAASDETTALTTGTNKAVFRMPYAFTLTAVRASLTTAGSTSGVTTIDINESGSSVLSTLITIDQGELTSTTAATPPVISDAALADDAQMTIDIDGLSGGATETGLKVTLIGYKTS
tara:strand:+ start:518 stop:1021 length:504 start_codon:yes stop_codon:yes gene_type:complete